MTRKRRVPVDVWRRLMGRLTKSAIVAGDATGYPLAQYRVDRDTAYEALDAALRQQAADIAHEWTRRDEAGLLHALGELMRRLDPNLRPSTVGKRGPARVADHTRETARQARAFAARLRELAGLVDVVVVGLELRAADYDAEQALDEQLDRLRASRA